MVIFEVFFSQRDISSVRLSIHERVPIFNRRRFHESLVKIKKLRRVDFALGGAQILNI